MKLAGNLHKQSKDKLWWKAKKVLYWSGRTDKVESEGCLLFAFVWEQKQKQFLISENVFKALSDKTTMVPQTIPEKDRDNFQRQNFQVADWKKLQKHALLLEDKVFLVCVPVVVQATVSYAFVFFMIFHFLTDFRYAPKATQYFHANSNQLHSARNCSLIILHVGPPTFTMRFL